MSAKTKAEAKQVKPQDIRNNNAAKALHLKPRMSEKAYASSMALNTYVFDVPVNANKVQITQAIEAQFGVTVLDVRPVIVKGKKARSIRIGAPARKLVMGKRPDVKKAYVKIKDGDVIPVFAAIQEAEAKEAKAAEKAAKKAKKETK
jgi:large subunit ribosomal protein L23